MTIAPAKTAAPFAREPGAGPVLNVLGVTQVYKLTSGDTGGALSLCEATVPPGAGAPPHVHANEDESFFVLSGEVLVEVEGEAAPRRVGPGGFVFGARGRRHAFRNIGDQTARLLVLAMPSANIDHMFGEIDAALAGGGAPDLANLAAIAARHGVTIEPPPAP
jgi:quercetin dioxygenase-like cupin family protein